MEVKSANVTLQMNQATTAVDNSGSEQNNKQNQDRIRKTVSGETVLPDDDPVTVFISAAGLRKSKSYEDISEQDDEFLSASEVDEMMKKVDGLSSQVINGHFSMTDRLAFQQEIKNLTDEMKRINGEGISFSKSDNIQLSQKISDLTTKMNEAAVYHRSANAYFLVKNTKTTKSNTRTTLDIAI